MVTRSHVKAGDELSFFGDDVGAKKLATSTNSFKFVPSDIIGSTKCVATRTGSMVATPIQQKNGKQKLQVDVVPLNTTKYLH